MSARRINSRRIKLHRSYTVEELARTLGVHKNTVRGWMRKGLVPVDTHRPQLYQGRTLRTFLERQQKARKRPCKPGTMYCLRCREPRVPAMGMVDCEHINAISGNLKAICEDCGTVMHRRARLSDLDAIMPGIEVQITGAQSRLKGCTSPSLNCDLAKEA